MKTSLNILLGLVSIICATVYGAVEFPDLDFSSVVYGEGVGPSYALLPAALLNRFEHPKRLERAFISYLAAAKIFIEQAKTISSVAWYHQATVGGLTQFRFFDTANGAVNTNMKDSNTFQFSQSEHNVIWAIRVASVINIAAPEGLYYTPGVSNDGTLQNCVLSVTNNGVINMQKYPLSESLDGLTTRDQGMWMLDEPFVWAAQSSLPAELLSQGGGALTANLHVRVTYIGLGLVSS